jgi:hypothetical protein
MSLRTALLNCLTALACIAMLLAYVHKYMRYQIVGNDNAVFVLDRQTTLMHRCDKDHCQLITPQGTTIETMRQLAGIPSPQDLIQLQNKQKEQQNCRCEAPKEDLFPSIKMQVTSFQTIDTPTLSPQKLQQQQKDMAQKINMPVMMEPKNPQQPFPTSDISLMQTGGTGASTPLSGPLKDNNSNASNSIPNMPSSTGMYGSNSSPTLSTPSTDTLYGSSSSTPTSSSGGMYGNTTQATPSSPSGGGMYGSSATAPMASSSDQSTAASGGMYGSPQTTLSSSSGDMYGSSTTALAASSSDQSAASGMYGSSTPTFSSGQAAAGGMNSNNPYLSSANISAPSTTQDMNSSPYSSNI